MEIEIKIIVKADKTYNKKHLVSDINYGFSGITGYEVVKLEINERKSLISK